MTRVRPLFTKAFWFDAAERAAKTAAQFAIGGLGLGEVTSAWETDWMLGAGFAASGAVLSILTSVVSSGVGPTGSPSLAPRAYYQLPATVESIEHGPEGP